MRRECLVVRAIGWLIVFLVAANNPVSAQTAGRGAVSIAAGPTDYDLSGTGTSFVINGRVEYVPVSPVVLEAGTTYFQYDPQVSGRTDRFLIPELGAQVQLPLGQVLPYIGGGGGLALVLSGPGSTELTVHIEMGVRVNVTNDWGVRGELRVRSIDPFVGTTADFTAGISRRF